MVDFNLSLTFETLYIGLYNFGTYNLGLILGLIFRTNNQIFKSFLVSANLKEEN